MRQGEVIIRRSLVGLLVCLGLACLFRRRRLLRLGIFLGRRGRRLGGRVLLGENDGGCEQEQPRQKNASFYESHRTDRNLPFIGCTPTIPGSGLFFFLILDLSSALFAAHYNSSLVTEVTHACKHHCQA